MSMKENMKNISRFKNCFLLWNLSKFDYKSFANSFICITILFSFILFNFPVLADTVTEANFDLYEINTSDLVSGISDNAESESNNDDYNIICENTTNSLQPYILNESTGIMEPVSLASQSLLSAASSLSVSSSDSMPGLPEYYYELEPLSLAYKYITWKTGSNVYIENDDVISNVNNVEISLGGLNSVYVMFNSPPSLGGMSYNFIAYVYSDTYDFSNGVPGNRNAFAYTTGTNIIANSSTNYYTQHLASGTSYRAYNQTFYIPSIALNFGSAGESYNAGTKDLTMRMFYKPVTGSSITEGSSGGTPQSQF